MPAIKNTPFTVVIDTREQTPWQFKTVDVIQNKQKFPLVVHTDSLSLKSGDYSIAGFEDLVAIERKSIGDALGTFTRGRERFERELDRMKTMMYAAIYNEGKPERMAREIRAEGRKVSMDSIMGSLRAWRQRYGVHVFWGMNRYDCERECIADLKQFWNDRFDEKYAIATEEAKWKVCFD